MDRKSIALRIAQLEERKKALKARLGKQERAHDTRRKILLGALVLHRLENANDLDFSRRLLQPLSISWHACCFQAAVGRHCSPAWRLSCSPLLHS